ncbi:MAG: hypothetical protein NTU98_09255 [Bacteroidetes bacterium]|nr:hypothetical protein [Bacteroidota bacterium]
MKKICIYPLVSLGLLFILTTGCKKKDDNTTPDNSTTSIVGKWTKIFDGTKMTIVFRSDGKYGVGSEVIFITDAGSYTISGNQVSMTDTWTGSNCGNITGKYLFAIQSNTITFNVINDTCMDRTELMQGSWNKEI